MFSFVLMAQISEVFRESALGFKPGLFVPQSPSTGSLSVDHSGGHSRPPRLSGGSQQSRCQCVTLLAASQCRCNQTKMNPEDKQRGGVIQR